jgi:hypothetical protein
MTDSNNPMFTEKPAQQIWESYLKQVDALCGLLDARQRTDIQMELKAHLLESYIQSNEGDEATRITAAIGKLGQPDEFIPLWVEERLLDGARPGASTRNLFHLLRINALKSIRQFVVSMLMGFGYLLSFYFFITAVLKLFYPQYVGLYITDSGWPFIGYVDAEGFTEILGYWLTPLGLAAAIGLQLFLNMLLRHRGRPADR